MRRYILFLISLWMLLLTSCYRDFQYDGDDFSPHIVLHSFVEADSAIRVTVSKSWLIGEEPSDSVLEGAKVSLYVNEERKDLATAIPRGGDQLRMVVEANGLQTVEATTVVPKKVEIKQVDYVLFDSVGSNIPMYPSIDAPFQLKVRFQDPPGERNYYGIGVCSSDSLVHLIYMNGENEPLFSELTMGGILDDLFIQDWYYGYTYPFSDEHIDGMEYDLNISVYVHLLGYWTPEAKECTYTICLYSLSESYYKYLLSLIKQNVSHLSEYGITDPNLTYRNVENGLGVFAAFQVDTFNIHWKEVKP